VPLAPHPTHCCGLCRACPGIVFTRTRKGRDAWVHTLWFCFDDPIGFSSAMQRGYLFMIDPKLLRCFRLLCGVYYGILD
jgi:hypothetical protein